ncbi:MAG: 3,4-dihydroxy-2-butanone-4-phosphate synthase, partial [Myxococcota bacterium]
INFMAKYGRGLICLTLTEEKIAQLELPMMVQKNSSPFKTGFTVSIEAATGVSTGISAHDRARTILAAVDDGAQPNDLVTPGHVFPIRARQGGVLVRTGQTEGSVDLAQLANLRPSGVICEIMNDDGTMARRPQLEDFAAKHGLRILTIAELVSYRLTHDTLVERVNERTVQTPEWGEMRVAIFRDKVDGLEHLALMMGDLHGEPPLVRVQSINLPSDLLGITLSGGGVEMRSALSQMKQAGRGVFIYLNHPTPSVTMADKLDRVAAGSNADVQRVGARMDLREFGTGAQILKLVGVKKFRLLTNSEFRIVGLEGFGLELVERLPLPMPSSA